MGTPSLTKSPAVASQHKYIGSVGASPDLVFTGPGNLYAFYFEDNSGANVFVQFFDAADPGDVTVGTTVPDFTIRVPSSGTVGKDVNDSPWRYFSLGCVVAVTTTRTGSGAPGTGATSNFWYWNI